MNQSDLTITLLTDGPPSAAFGAINNVRAWWIDQIEGAAAKAGDEFVVRFADIHYSRQRVTEIVPDKKVVWLVTDSQLNFVADPHEWTGTEIIFGIAEEGEGTQITFTHKGLVPGIQCFGACSGAWKDYINGSLLQLIQTGKGTPYLKSAEAAQATV